MLGRRSSATEYAVTGWSFRLFPPAKEHETSFNRGSAFHSCLAMSHQEDVDALYLLSAGRAHRFCKGSVAQI
jgi:hypothetical protein